MSNLSHTIDTVLRVKVKHHADHLARLTKAISDQDGLIGEVATISVGEDDVMHDVTIETHDDAHTKRVLEAVQALDAVEIMSATDRVFDWHRGGKIHQRSQKPITKADIVTATTARGGLIPSHLVQRKQVILALSNPTPEIRPDEALAAGWAFAGDGRSINNALAFPGPVNGLLLARCRTLRSEMLITAAEFSARMAAPGALVPNPLDRAVHTAVTDAVRARAHQLGLTGTCDLG